MKSSYWNDELLNLTKPSTIASLSELITQNDVTYIREQSLFQKDSILHPTDIPRKKIERKYIDQLLGSLDIETYWEEIYKLGSGYYSLNLPLFSIDKTVAIFRYSYSCGSLCAFSGTGVYKKVNGKWTSLGSIGFKIVS
jgi:hypothetical protein